jgi:hypothetical protein
VSAAGSAQFDASVVDLGDVACNKWLPIVQLMRKVAIGLRSSRCR